MSNGNRQKANSEKKAKGKSKTKSDSLQHQAKLSPSYGNEDFKHKFLHSFKEKQCFKDDSGAVLYSSPFQASFLPKILDDDQFLEGLRDEIQQESFFNKSNDLYKFQQTDDLKKFHSPHVAALRRLFENDVRSWIQDVTGIELNDRVDLTCSRYDYTDVLLCHDDELDTRRIAFILYLVPAWGRQDGGLLDLYTMDEHGDPAEMSLSLVPQWNSLAWFEVTEASHHQVSEVLSEDKSRLSVNGWFHSRPVPRPPRFVEPPLPTNTHTDIDEDEVCRWINPIYFDPEVQGQIQEKFESDSEIELQDFLKEELYAEVTAALQESSLTWIQRGPPNKRSYDVVEGGAIPSIVEQCVRVLQSEAMFLTLSNLTGLTLHPLVADSDTNSDAGAPQDPPPLQQNPVGAVMATAENDDIETEHKNKRQKINNSSNNTDTGETGASDKLHADDNMRIISASDCKARCRVEVRRWSHGSYTLVHDTDLNQQQFALDAMFFCACKGWKQEFGGYTSYIAKEEDEELLTVLPVENSLALVYRDRDTLRFVKHINHRASVQRDTQGSHTGKNGQHFYDIALVYHE